MTYEAWLNAPKHWWTDVWTFNHVRAYYEKKLKAPKAQVPTMNFEDMKRG